LNSVKDNDISGRVWSYIETTFLFGDSSRLSSDTSFLDSSILDSTGMLELISFIEQEFAIRIDPTELIPDNLDSISKVTRFIEKKKGSSSLDQAV